MCHHLKLFSKNKINKKINKKINNDKYYDLFFFTPVVTSFNSAVVWMVSILPLIF